ncbi:hypothetical protein C0995_014332, partial [Termitomyces sp. Mi166
ITLVNGLIPKYKIVNTGSTPDPNSDPNRKIKPDPTMYKKSVDTSNNKTHEYRIQEEQGFGALCR